MKMMMKKNNWFIKDGDIIGKNSTNDTWMYTSKETLIYDQMIFKTNHNLFKYNILLNNNLILLIFF